MWISLTMLWPPFRSMWVCFTYKGGLWPVWKILTCSMVFYVFGVFSPHHGTHCRWGTPTIGDMAFWLDNGDKRILSLILMMWHEPHIVVWLFFSTQKCHWREQHIFFWLFLTSNLNSKGKFEYPFSSTSILIFESWKMELVWGRYKHLKVGFSI